MGNTIKSKGFYMNHPANNLNSNDNVLRQVAFIEELQRRLAPADFGAKSGAFLPGSQSSPNLAAAAAAAAAQHHQSPHEGGAPFELRALEVALDVVSHRAY